MNSEERRGVGFGFAAYFLWGVFPLYFKLLDRSGALEILMHRILWSLVACSVLVAVTRAWGQLRELARTPRTLGLLAVAAVAIALNWGIYIWAVNADHVIEASLGYFINPLVTIALGVLVLRERLRPMQWVAVGVGVLAVAVLSVAYGRPPWIALSLAASFGSYGLLKNRIGRSVGAVAGLTTETAVLAPFALVVVLISTAHGNSTFGDRAPWQALLLVSTGVVTVVPLLLFAAAARRVPLTTMGLLQYLTPVLQLICGVVVLGETMSAARWAGFGLVWVGLVLLSADSLRQARRTSRLSRPASTQPDQREPEPAQVPA
jgi:chloramphenicol-sensitive protein RarD